MLFAPDVIMPLEVLARLKIGSRIIIIEPPLFPNLNWKSREVILRDYSTTKYIEGGYIAISDFPNEGYEMRYLQDYNKTWALRCLV